MPSRLEDPRGLRLARCARVRGAHSAPPPQQMLRSEGALAPFWLRPGPPLPPGTACPRLGPSRDRTPAPSSRPQPDDGDSSTVTSAGGPTIPAATVALVARSTSTRLPVTRLLLYGSTANGVAVTIRATPISLSWSSLTGSKRSVFTSRRDVTALTLA